MNDLLPVGHVGALCLVKGVPEELAARIVGGRASAQFTHVLPPVVKILVLV